MSKLLPLFMNATGLSEHDVLAIVRNAPVRYKTFKIPKRNGGERLISQPAREVKAFQRILAAEVISHLPMHPAATAYREGISIRENAAAHVKNGPILKFDFENFFPSIHANDWHVYCEKKSLLDDPLDRYISTNILFHRVEGSVLLRLAIGAPSSPCLSNVLMNDFDTTISDAIKSDKVTYTRYADDLTFSARRTGYLTGVEKKLRRAIRDIKSPSLTINESKTILATPKYKRMVTGLILANDGRVSLGYQRKRLIRAALHRQSCGKLTNNEQVWLAGLLAFVNDVEPEFLERLVKKYGPQVISELKLARKTRIHG